MSPIWIPQGPITLHIVFAMGSIARAKRSSDRGRPCLVPRLKAKLADTISVFYSLAPEPAYSNLTHSIYLRPIPLLPVSARGSPN